MSCDRLKKVEPFIKNKLVRFYSTIRTTFFKTLTLSVLLGIVLVLDAFAF